MRLEIGHSESLGRSLGLGASLAVAGVCLTVTSADAGRSVVEVSPETQARTNLGSLAAGDEVNLEPALRVGDPLGGHWVQGHVDRMVGVLAVVELERHREMTVELPPEVAVSVVEKGSVALDGVSLTVASLGADRFSVALIPHTLESTTLGGARVGQRLNFEADILAKYVQRALSPRWP